MIVCIFSRPIRKTNNVRKYKEVHKMSGESKQQKNQEMFEDQDGPAKDQKESSRSTGYGDKKLNGPDQPST